MTARLSIDDARVIVAGLVPDGLCVDRLTPKARAEIKAALIRVLDLVEPIADLVPEEMCPGHVASAHDPKICGRCGVHINSLRPPDDDTNPDEAPR